METNYYRMSAKCGGLKRTTTKTIAERAWEEGRYVLCDECSSTGVIVLHRKGN